MVVAMAVMGVVQVPVHQIADMIPVRHGLMPAAWAMNMVVIVAQITLHRRTGVRIGGVHV